MLIQQLVNLASTESEQAEPLTLKGAWQLCSTAMTASLTVCVPFSERLVRPTAMEMLDGRDTGPSLATCSLQQGNCHMSRAGCLVIIQSEGPYMATCSLQQGYCHMSELDAWLSMG